MIKDNIKDYKIYGKICAVSGHRILKKDFSEEKLKELFRLLILDGFKVFLSGMAIGFDTVCCKVLFELKKEYDIKIIGCIPFKGQESTFSLEQKKTYNKYVQNCDDTVILYDEYIKCAFFERNRLMIDNCELLVAYIYENKGGTYYTVKYANSKEKEIIKFI